MLSFKDILAAVPKLNIEQLVELSHAIQTACEKVQKIFLSPKNNESPSLRASTDKFSPEIAAIENKRPPSRALPPVVEEDDSRVGVTKVLQNPMGVSNMLKNIGNSPDLRSSNASPALRLPQSPNPYSPKIRNENIPDISDSAPEDEISEGELVLSEDELDLEEHCGKTMPLLSFLSVCGNSVSYDAAEGKLYFRDTDTSIFLNGKLLTDKTIDLGQYILLFSFEVGKGWMVYITQEGVEKTEEDDEEENEEDHEDEEGEDHEDEEGEEKEDDYEDEDDNYDVETVETDEE
jgi:hypothetical protein